jgi:hypothetical protein
MSIDFVLTFWSHIKLDIIFKLTSYKRLSWASDLLKILY